MRFERVKLPYGTVTGPANRLNVEDLSDKTLQVLNGAGFNFDIEGSLDGINWFLLVNNVTGTITNQAIADLAKFLRVDIATVGTAPEINIYGRNLRTQ